MKYRVTWGEIHLTKSQEPILKTKGTKATRLNLTTQIILAVAVDN